MPGTFTRLLYHVVFSTKHRANLIAPELQARLYDYLGGIVRGERGTAHEIGGVADHVDELVGIIAKNTGATLIFDEDPDRLVSRLVRAFERRKRRPRRRRLMSFAQRSNGETQRDQV